MVILRFIYIENGQINFSFLGGGMRVIYNSDIFKKLRPPLGFKKSQIEIGKFTE